MSCLSPPPPRVMSVDTNVCTRNTRCVCLPSSCLKGSVHRGVQWALHELWEKARKSLYECDGEYTTHKSYPETPGWFMMAYMVSPVLRSGLLALCHCTIGTQADTSPMISKGLFFSCLLQRLFLRMNSWDVCFQMSRALSIWIQGIKMSKKLLILVS